MSTYCQMEAILIGMLFIVGAQQWNVEDVLRYLAKWEAKIWQYLAPLTWQGSNICNIPEGYL
ncbi:MAG: hypothetical protein HKN87_23075 [Saprospiraceae bacterium]|nr:hypothetical protein [Saprospiraceae bacterium]